MGARGRIDDRTGLGRLVWVLGASVTGLVWHSINVNREAVFVVNARARVESCDGSRSSICKYSLYTLYGTVYVASVSVGKVWEG